MYFQELFLLPHDSVEVCLNLHLSLVSSHQWESWHYLDTWPTKPVLTMCSDKLQYCKNLQHWHNSTTFCQHFNNISNKEVYQKMTPKNLTNDIASLFLRSWYAKEHVCVSKQIIVKIWVGSIEKLCVYRASLTIHIRLS